MEDKKRQNTREGEREREREEDEEVGRYGQTDLEQERERLEAKG